MVLGIREAEVYLMVFRVPAQQQGQAYILMRLRRMLIPARLTGRQNILIPSWRLKTNGD